MDADMADLIMSPHRRSTDRCTISLIVHATSEMGAGLQNAFCTTWALREANTAEGESLPML